MTLTHESMIIWFFFSFLIFFFLGYVFQIKLNYPEEYLVSVSGYYCPVVHGGSPVIRSLTLKSNKRTFGPYGVEEGTPFSFPIQGGLIVGFKGRNGWYLDAIGFHIVSHAQSTKLIERVQKGFRRFASTASSKPSVTSTATKNIWRWCFEFEFRIEMESIVYYV